MDEHQLSPDGDNLRTQDSDAACPQTRQDGLYGAIRAGYR